MSKVSNKQLYQAYMEINPAHEDESVSKNKVAVNQVAEGLRNCASAFEKLPVALRDEFALCKPLAASRAVRNATSNHRQASMCSRALPWCAGSAQANGMRGPGMRRIPG